MYEDYYSDDEEKVDSIVVKNFINKISNDILFNTKDNIKNYVKILSFLSKEDIAKINKGKGPFVITVEYLNLNEAFRTFDDNTKKRSKPLFLLYITNEQARTYINFRYERKYNDIIITEKQLKDTLKKTKKLNKKLKSLFNEFADINEDPDILIQRQYNDFISNLMQYSSKTPMLQSEKQQDFKVIKNLIKQKQRIGNYYQTLVYLNVKQIHNILKKMHPR